MPSQATDQDWVATRDALKERLAGQLDLPMLPETATRVLAACRRSDTGAKELADLVAGDPQLASRMIRLSNSAMSAPVQPIESIHAALARLGFGRVAEAALAVTAGSRLFAVPGREKRVRSIYRHAVLSGALAREVARARRDDVETAFMAGLFHDVAKPFLLQCIADWRDESDCEMETDLEDRLLDGLHEDIGGRLIEHWALGEGLVKVIKNHHQREFPIDDNLSWTLRLADDLAHAIVDEEIHEVEEFSEVLKAHVALDPLDLYTREVDEIVSRFDDVLAFSESIGQ